MILIAPSLHPVSQEHISCNTPGFLNSNESISCLFHPLLLPSVCDRLTPLFRYDTILFRARNLAFFNTGKSSPRDYPQLSWRSGAEMIGKSGQHRLYPLDPGLSSNPSRGSVPRLLCVYEIVVSVLNQSNRGGIARTHQ